jgi:hypothetical protein
LAVMKLLLYHKISKTDMICVAKSGLIAHSVKARIFNNMLHVRYVHLIKGKHIHKRQTHLAREDVT